MTVIDGLARGARGPRHLVLVSAGTYLDRYESADVIEYDAGPWLTNSRARFDAVAARAGIGRPFRSVAYRRATQQVPRGEATLLLHNAPFTGHLTSRDVAAVLYAHNEVLPGTRWAAGRALERVEAIVAVSTWLAERLQTKAPPALRGRVVPVLNGVDTAAFTVPERSAREPRRILFLGRVIPEKGPDLLLDALVKLRRPELQVRIVGSNGFSALEPLSSYEKALRAKATLLPGSVEFLPFVERAGIPELFRWADLVVLPARWHEPCGLTLLEALASGAPTVISDSGGMPEVANGAALVVPRDDVRALASSIADLLDDSRLRLVLGTRARHRAEELDWTTRSALLDRSLQGLGLPDSSSAHGVPNVHDTKEDLP